MTTFATEGLHAVPAGTGSWSRPRSRGARYLFFTNECVGLGHLRRGLHLAEAVRAQDPDASCLLVTGSTVPDGTLRPGIDTVKLPALSRDVTGRLGSPSLPVTAPNMGALRSELALATALAFDPDVVVVDKLPAGLGDELLPTLTALRLRGRCRIVLGLRDIEDEPEAVRRRWAAAGTLDHVRRFYDHVLVYGPESSLDALDCVGGAALGLPVDHVGYVGGPLPGAGPDDLPGDYLLVTAGGGVDGFALVESVIDAVRIDPVGVPVVAVAGPLMPAEQVAELQERAQGLDVRVERSRSDLAAAVVGARAVVSMAGYNTVSEVLRAGKPVLLVPRVRPSSEQLLRAANLAACGAATVLHPDELDAASMRGALARLLSAPVPTVDLREYDGAAAAARALGAMVTR